jgi:acetyl esterase/lipase
MLRPLTAFDLCSEALTRLQGQAGLSQTGLAYGALSRQHADVYWPPASMARPALGWPTVVFFYGGAWNRGARGDYRFVGRALASRGMLVVVADYRLYPEVRYPDFLSDAAQAVAWARAQLGHWGGDTQRFFVMGHSAGAYNAAMLALDPRWLGAVALTPQQLAGWIGLAGPYDFLPVTVDEVKPVFNYPNSLPDSQPLAHASAASPPVMLGMAPADKLVNPKRNTAQLAQRLQEQGVAVALHSYARTSHITIVGALGLPLRQLAPVLDDVAAFVAQPGARGATRLAAVAP